MVLNDQNALAFRFATPADASLLATLNFQLIRDERHRNSMDLSQLTRRMENWLSGEYKAVTFENKSHVIGYVLYRHEEQHIYLQQMFVIPEARR